MVVTVVMSLVAIVAAVAMPNLDTALTNQRLRDAATDLVSALLLARSEAIKRGVQVQVAPLSRRRLEVGLARRRDG